MVANPVRGLKEVPRSTGHIMVTTRYSDQQGSKSRQKVMRLYKRWHRPITKRHIKSPLLLLLLLFLTFSVLVANPKKLLYTVANPARGLLNREKRTKEKVWQHTPPPTPHTARSEKINKITRRIYRRYAGGRSRVRTRIPSARRLGLWVWLRNSTLPSAIIRFPVSLLLSSPGDV